MEFYNEDHKNELIILNIDSSEPHSFSDEMEEGNMKLQFTPLFIIDIEKEIYAVKITLQFLSAKEEKLLASPVKIVVSFKTKEFGTIFAIEQDKIEAKDLDMMFTMFDTAIGIMRGVLFEQTKNTPLEGMVLPFIELNRFINEAKVKVIGNRN